MAVSEAGGWVGGDARSGVGCFISIMVCSEFMSGLAFAFEAAGLRLLRDGDDWNTDKDAREGREEVEEEEEEEDEEDEEEEPVLMLLSWGSVIFP